MFHQLKLLFEQIATDWQRITDKSEREILAKYSEEGRLLVIFYTGKCTSPAVQAKKCPRDVARFFLSF